MSARDGKPWEAIGPRIPRNLGNRYDAPTRLAGQARVRGKGHAPGRYGVLVQIPAYHGHFQPPLQCLHTDNVMGNSAGASSMASISRRSPFVHHQTCDTTAPTTEPQPTPDLMSQRSRISDAAENSKEVSFPPPGKHTASRG